MGNYDWWHPEAKVGQLCGTDEATARAAIFAALDWLEENPSAEPLFKGRPGQRAVDKNNEHADALLAAVRRAAPSAKLHCQRVALDMYFRVRELGIGWLKDFIAHVTSVTVPTDSVNPG